MAKKSSLGSIVKFGFTVAIFVALFAEFGGGPVAVPKTSVQDGSAFLMPDPASPGVIARWFKGAKALPPIPVPAGEVCKAAAGGKVIYLKTADGKTPALKTLRHCEGDELKLAEATAGGDLVGIDTIPGDQVYMVTKGFQIVEVDYHDLWREITGVTMLTFLPWLAFAMISKLIGIFANVYRWKVLLDAQGVNLSFGWLNASYWVGRYWGIVTPSTMGLDGWRLYDSIRATGKPVECTTALAVERLIGLVGLLGAILLILPFADIGGQDFKSILDAVKLPLAAAVLGSSLFLLQPSWFAWLPKMVPHKGVRSFAEKAVKSATAYSSNRMALIIATVCAVLGQFTTFGMYVGNAYAFGVTGVNATQILAAAAVMTFGTFIFPSASGEGVREFAFVALLGGHTTAAKAFLIGHLGFWIEKLPLGVPGAFLLWKAPEAYKRVSVDDLARTRADAEAAARAT